MVASLPGASPAWVVTSSCSGCMVIGRSGNLESGGRRRPGGRPKSGQGPDAGARAGCEGQAAKTQRSEEHTSELQSIMRISYAVLCLKKKKTNNKNELTPP